MIKFKDGKYETAAQKLKIYKAMDKFLKSGLKKGNFTNELYEYMHVSMNVFIAHYNKEGFYINRFANPSGLVQTLEMISSKRFYETESLNLDLHLEIQKLILSYSIQLMKQAKANRIAQLESSLIDIQCELKNLKGGIYA